MVNGDAQRVEVRLAVEYPGSGATSTLGDGSMRPIDPIPPICPRHGEPETGRVRVTVAADASEPRQGSNRFGSALEAAYTVQVAAVDWPVCARCVAVRTRWQIAAAATCTVLGVIFLAWCSRSCRALPRSTVSRCSASSVCRSSRSTSPCGYSSRSGRRWECRWPRTVRNSSSRRRIRSSRGRSRRSGCSHRFPSPAALTSGPAVHTRTGGRSSRFTGRRSAVKIEHSTPASTSELGSEEKKSLAVRA